MTVAGALKSAAIFFVGPLLLFIIVVLAIALVQKRFGMATGSSTHKAYASDDQLLRGEGLYSGASAAPPMLLRLSSAVLDPGDKFLICLRARVFAGKYLRQRPQQQQVISSCGAAAARNNCAHHYAV